MSLAVVKGPTAGARLTTLRKRISVGAGADNDLIINKSGLALRHFLVVVDAGRWQVHTLSADNQITIDRRWAHPTTGRRGALILAGQAEILLCPGTLDDWIVDHEIQVRIEGTIPSPTADALIDVSNQPVAFDDEPLAAAEPTITARVAEPPTVADPELLELAMAPTVAGGRPPDSLREAARARLLSERSPVTIEGPKLVGKDPFEDQTVGVSWQDGKPVTRSLGKPPAKRSAWDVPKMDKGPKGQLTRPLPEVLAEPESQMTVIPGSVRSAISERPNFGNPDAKVIEFRPNENAWGDSKSEAQPKGNAWGEPEDKKSSAWNDDKKVNAWGDVSPVKALVKNEPKNAWGGQDKNVWGDRTPVQPNVKNAWGDPKPGAKEPPRATKSEVPWNDNRSTPGPRVSENVGLRFGIADLAAGERRDPALMMLAQPDGPYATAIRLLGTRLETMQKSSGYRAYMFTSAEPLTGKTTSIFNLAFALAEDTQRRVAVIEANFRYPRFAEILHVDEHVGVLPVLEGKATLPEAVIRIRDRNLVLLPSGGRHPNPAQALSSPRFKSLMAELVDTVDIALVDAPSIVPFADANQLLPLVDGAFLVVVAGATKTGQLARATEQIGESRVLGALFNQLPGGHLKELKRERSLRLKQK